MSYSVYLEGVTCDHCGAEPVAPDCPDPTYNLTPIFDLALTGEGLPNPDVAEAAVVLFGNATDRPRGLRLFSGKTGADSLAMLNAALDRLRDARFRDRFEALEPDNGWGDLTGACRVMQRYKELAERYPKHVWKVT